MWKSTCAKNFDDEVFDKIEVTCARAFLLDDLVLSVRVEEDREYLPYVSQEVLVDALVSDDVGLKFLELELLGILVQDGLGGSCLNSHSHR